MSKNVTSFKAGGQVGAALASTHAHELTRELNPSLTASRALLEENSQVARGDWKKINKAALEKISTHISFPSQDGDNTHMPETLEIREIKLGKGGPKFAIAENFGATPTKLSFPSKKGEQQVLSSKVNQTGYQYERSLGMAGTIGGAPIVALAGRTIDDDLQPAFTFNGRKVSFEDSLLGENGRIPKDPGGIMAHGPLFTSTHWKLDEDNIRTINNGEGGLELTYKLDAHEDPAMKDLIIDPGEEAWVAVTYTVIPVDEGGRKGVRFDTKLDLTNLMIGSLAIHNFFKTKANDRLETDATLEAETEENKALPTGNLKEIEPESLHDFSAPGGKTVHTGDFGQGDLEIVLTGYDQTDAEIPKATIHRTNGVTIENTAAGVSGRTAGFDGFLACNAAGEDCLMLEPIARYPNIFNKPCDDPKVKPIAPGPKEHFKAHNITVATMAV